MQSLSDIIDIDTLDADGAIAETAEKAGIDRASFFKKAGLAGAGLAGSSALMGFLPSIASAATTKNDVSILNFALTLEFLEAAFYKEAVASNFPGVIGQFATLVFAHETTHVNFLKKALGRAAVKSPKFEFGNTTSDQPAFQLTSFALENTGVHAYLGQAPKINSKAILGAAATIATIEARHAAVIGALNQKGNPIGKNGATPDGAFDVPFSKKKVLSAVARTKFIVS